VKTSPNFRMKIRWIGTWNLTDRLVTQV
jgi:hypothetical protein